MINRSHSALGYLQPTAQSRTIDWFRRHARNVDGRPYSHESYPHLGAPGGPADAMDDPNVRRIWMQFASRLGKTFFGQCCAMKKADCNPGPMMFATSVEKTAGEVIERTYQMIDHSPRVCSQLRPKSRRRQSCIDFAACQMHVAWARSVSTLSDKEVEFGHAGEIDKWEHLSTSKEADPLRLFLDRFKNRPHHKVVLESTPSVKGRSRIEAGRLGSTNCKFCVPCPHANCGRYQTLHMGVAKLAPAAGGDGATEGGYRLRWDRLSNGHNDKDLARRTAVYHCQFCGGRIEDYQRSQIMRLGVWCPEGCTIKDAEARDAAINGHDWRGWKHASWIEGTPLRDGAEAGYQLSSLYALSLTWGDVASEFVACKGKPQDLRNFINQWLAETWEPVKRQATWEQLGERIIAKDSPRGIVPLWGSLLTCGIDRQSGGDGGAGDRFPWTVDAWGPEWKCATIAYGESDSFDNLLLDVISAQWNHADGGVPLSIAFTLIDSGYRPDGVYEFCRRCHAKQLNVWPSKGSPAALDSDYRRAALGPNTSMPGMILVHVDTIRSQLWLEHQLTNPDGLYSLHAGSILDHQDFLQQLLNDAAVNELDKTNNVRQSWERIDTHTPNDFRDCRRYAYVARLIAAQGREIPERSAGTMPVRRPAVIGSGVDQNRGTRW